MYLLSVAAYCVFKYISSSNKNSLICTCPLIHGFFLIPNTTVLYNPDLVEPLNVKFKDQHRYKGQL